jgi:glycosyltransferase involved in cell wall biosynthesis
VASVCQIASRIVRLLAALASFCHTGSIFTGTEPSSKGLTRGWPGKQLLKWQLRRWVGRQRAGGDPNLMLSTLPFSDEIVRECGLRDVWYRIPNPLLPQISSLAEISERKARRRLARFQRIYTGQNLIAISQGIADELNDKLEIAGTRIATIYNPFDFDAIARLAALPEPKLPDEPYIVHAARFVPQKRHDLILDAYALSKLPHRLVLLTRNSETLRDMIRHAG